MVFKNFWKGKINLIEEINPEWRDLYEEICSQSRSPGCLGQAEARRRGEQLSTRPKIRILI